MNKVLFCWLKLKIKVLLIGRKVCFVGCCSKLLSKLLLFVFVGNNYSV